MKTTITKNDLFNIEQEFIHMQRHAPGLTLLLKTRLNFFFDRAGMHLKGLHERLREIKDNYVEKDEAGNYLTEDVEGQKRLKYLSSKLDLLQGKTLNKDEVRQAFTDECNKVFAETITLDLYL
jgi:hypothetical protein